MKSKWTPEEIATIKSSFLAGKRVKIIANEVGRSQTAVNKFLSRSGIRTRRWTIEKAKPVPHSKIFNIPSQSLREVRNTEVIADFNDVLRYLKQNGYAISKNSKREFSPMDNYAINEKPISEVKLLLLANRLRCENRQPIFSVPELAWD